MTINIVISKLGLQDLVINKTHLPDWALFRINSVKYTDTQYIHISSKIIYEIECQIFFDRPSIFMRCYHRDIDQYYIRDNMCGVFIFEHKAREFIYDIIDKFGDEKSKRVIREKSSLHK